MADAVAEAPAPVQTTPAAVPEVPKGIQAAMAGFKEATTPKAAPAKSDPAVAKPDPKVATPDPKAAPVKAAVPAKTPDKWDKAPPELKNEHFKTKREADEKIAGYEKRIREIEAKPRETVADAKAVEQFQKQIKEMNERLAATDFRQSNEFKAQFVERWNSEYSATVNEVKQLMLTFKTVDGEEKQRQATEADFQKIMRLPAGEQDKVVAELFGPYANRVFARMFRLQEIEQSAERAVADHTKNAEAKAAEAKSAAEKSEQEYGKFMEQSSEELVKEWPEHFALDDKDPDASTALQKGYDFVDHATKNGASMTPQDRAAHIAVIRARAAAFPRAVLQTNRLKEEVESLKTELAKYRKSDPGSETETPGATQAVEGEVPKGIEAASRLVTG